MSENPEMPVPVNSSLTTCSNCHSAMPSELRFCRNCGFRLGHGSGEYDKTIRFPGEGGSGTVSAPAPTKKRRRISGMAWVFVGLLAFFICAAAFTALVSPVRNHVRRTETSVTKSYFGVKDWETVETKDGVTFMVVTPPGGPADKAGLVGGDVIVKFDGQRINNEDDMNRVLVRTPVGKTVDIEFLRDGETRTTKLTTVSQEETERLSREFERRPRQEFARFGYDDGDSERVEIPGTKLHGVRLDDVFASMPADMAGVKEGDVVIQFDDIPIRTPQELAMRVRRAVPYNTVKLVVMRGPEKLEIPVRMGRQD
jgi:C-terminal processing protease CtpA/Prc